MRYLISIIIPVYNAERYIARCLESVLLQDYTNTEVIIVNDGSSDLSGSICETYARAHENIRVCHIPNGGASLARKKGLEIANGEYVTFVDSDDYVSPNYVSSMYNLIEKYKTKISACRVKSVASYYDYKHKHNGNGGGCAADFAGVEEKLLLFDELMPRFFKYEYWGFPGGLYHRSVFDSLTFPKATLSEDYYVKMQIFCRERKLAVTNAPLYCYEYHSSSLSHTRLSSRAFEEFENVKAVYDYAIVHCSDYSDYAFSNVIETSVKLCLMSRNKQEENLYRSQYLAVLSFLKENKSKIINLEVLNKNVKLIAWGLCTHPQITKRICQLWFRG